jgi:hypothetical protein
MLRKSRQHLGLGLPTQGLVPPAAPLARETLVTRPETPIHAYHRRRADTKDHAHLLTRELELRGHEHRESL